MQLFKNKSILCKIQFIQIITLIGAFIGVFIILSTIFNDYIQENHKKYLKQLSYNISNDINHHIPMYKSYLLNISEDQYLQQYNKTFEEANLAQFLLKNKNIFQYLSYMEEDGQVIYKLNNKILYTNESNYKKNDFFTDILKNPNKVMVSNIEYNDDIKEHVIYFALHMRSYYENKFKGVLIATIPISQFVKTKIIDKNIIARIVMNNNYIVYSSNQKDIGTKQLVKNDNENLTFQKEIINKNTILQLSYPQYLINAQIYDILIMIAIVFLMVIVAALILVYRANKKMLEPINTLVKGIDNVSKGHFNSNLEVPREKELKPIAKSFNKMIKELKISQKNVEQNKEELEKLNYSLSIEISKQHKSLKDKDKMLFQKAKLASMGEMIDTIIHQWRQPLSIISTIASGTLVKISCNIDIEKEELLKNSNRTMSQIKHLDSTIDEFRHFFREDNNFEVLPIKSSIQSALKLINNHVIQNDVTIDMKFEDDLLIELIPNEFKHVLINLINNSIDAFNENKIENPKLNITAYKSNKQIQLQIIDNAGGIKEEILPKIFLADFTTKEINKGTGIGLYITKQILNKINATISAKNVILEDNKTGAEFTILFPTVLQS